jgi:glycosyltransferase involved in cell wall biosynthesis
MWQSIKIGIPDAELHVFSGGFFKRDVDTQNYYDWIKVEYSYLKDVYFNPLVSEQKLEKEYQTSYLYLYPGKTPETFGISVLHAIATGTPIVMNAVDGLIETAPDSVAKHAFFGGTQQEEFIAHIMRLYYDKNNWLELHNATRTIDCSWSTVATELLKHV